MIGIGPAVLTQRLHDLEGRGIVRRRRPPGPGRIDVYELTEWGYGLEAVNTALSLWAVTSHTLPREADMSPDTVVLAMRAHARPASRGPGEQRVALILTDSRRQDAQPGVGHHPGLEGLCVGGVPLEQLPNIRMSGSNDTVRQLIEATSLSGSPDSSMKAKA